MIGLVPLPALGVVLLPSARDLRGLDLRHAVTQDLRSAKARG